MRSKYLQKIINFLWHLPQAVIANQIYGNPSKNLTIVGVTGTDGKTTTANMLYHILQVAGYKVALISTVSAKIGTEDIDTGFHVTTPDSFLLQKLLKRIKKTGCTHVVIEATSHGLEQFRLWGVHFTGGIVTNITMDHLDYHKTWHRYVLAKAKLFKHVTFSILNCEDKSYSILVKQVSGKQISYGRKKGDIHLSNTKIKLTVLGEFNKLNALAALAAALELRVTKEDGLLALENFTGVTGRMELMQSNPFVIMVDFAHTPNALHTALTYLRETCSSRVISVFGCAGQRDPYRRRMGEVSARLADITIITAEDPRDEGVEKISNEIAGWAVKGGAIECQMSNFKSQNIKKHIYVKIPDRNAAIEFALSIAKTGDVVGVFGKGHEKSMCFGKEEVSWSDQESIRNILES